MASLGLALLLGTAPAQAVTTVYTLTMTGAQEVPGPGDPDGSGTGTVTLDDTNILGNGTISWAIAYLNLDTVTAMHIHGPGGSPGNAAPVLVNLGVTGVPGVSLAGVDTSTPVATIQAIMANPNDFYVNIHTLSFGNGAVRGQLVPIPEPSTALLVAFGAVAIGVRRRIGR